MTGRVMKESLYSIFYYVERIFLFFSKCSETCKGVIVVRTDAIGDYILFRNFLELIYKKYGRFTLVGNVAYEDLVLNLDQQYLKSFIPIDRKKISHNIIYRFRLFWKIRKFSYSVLINPIYSRDRISEDISRVIIAQEKIASVGDMSNLSLDLKKKYDKTYTKLLLAKNCVMFEFFRNLEFFKALFSHDIDVKFSLGLSEYKNIDFLNFTSPYSVLFIGASEKFRKWKNENFLEVGKYLYQTFRHSIVICGGKEDFGNGEYIAKCLNKASVPSQNLCGKTSLMQLISILAQSYFVISNETSSVHIAQALGHPRIFVISNGNHLYRFTPYPPSFNSGYHVIFHQIVCDNFDNYDQISQYLEPYSILNINDIDFHRVIECIAKER